MKNVTKVPNGVFTRVCLEVIPEEPLAADAVKEFRRIQKPRYLRKPKESTGNSVISYLYDLTGTEIESLRLSLSIIGLKKKKKLEKDTNDIIIKLAKKGFMEKYNLEKDDVEAIFLCATKEKYYESVYRKITKAFTGRNIDDFGKVKSYMVHLLSALRKLEPVKNTVLYRGFIKDIKDTHFRMGPAHKNDIDYTKLKKDDVVIWDNFASTSTKERTAESFISGNRGFLFEIHGNYCGYNIKDFSQYSEEGILRLH